MIGWGEIQRRKEIQNQKPEPEESKSKKSN
jgi:hypothetical protein